MLPATAHNFNFPLIIISKLSQKGNPYPFIMTFYILLYLSVFICLIGLVLRISTWFSHSISPVENNVPMHKRIAAAIKGSAHVFFSKKIILMIESFIVDVLFQKKTFKKSILRWVMHFLIFYGFILLLLMHALESVVSEALFNDYYSTINPFLFLRNLFGIMVLVGTGIAFFRRIFVRSSRITTSIEDWLVLVVIALIILSGIFLEASKIMSYSEFQSMTEEYGDIDDSEDMQALESFWVKNYGVVSPNTNLIFDEKTLLQGSEINDMSCLDCHSSAKWAFASFATAKSLKPTALFLDRIGAVNILWYIHIVACFFFLAWIPFSKMFHMIATPISLLANAAMKQEKVDPANILNKQMIELDACTRCGMCNQQCSSIMFFESIENPFILPAEKIKILKKAGTHKKFEMEELKNIQRGLYMCTNCGRCVETCPSGINLKELFINARHRLLRREIPEPLIYTQLSFALSLEQESVDNHLKALKSMDRLLKRKFESLPDVISPISLELTKAEELANNTYKSCYYCQSCSNICPIVKIYEKPNEALGLLPHQIIYCLGLGLIDIALGAKMIWACSGCYLCQENCPQKVELTDIFYNLKNVALKKIT